MLCFLSCGNHVKKEYKEGLLCKCFIFPTGTLGESYQINVYDDGAICTYYGERKTDFLTCIEHGKVLEGVVIEKIEKTKKGKLNAESFKNLKKSLSNIEGKQCLHLESLNWKDSWCVLLETSKSIYLHRHCDFDNNEIEHIYKQLKKYSPIPIDIHGWA